MPIYKVGTGAVALRELPYFRRVLGIHPNNIVAYWPISESYSTGGTNSVKDISGRGNHATPTNVVLGSSGIRVGRTSGLFNGASSKLNVTVGNLASQFNGNEGSMIAWLKVSAASIWTDNTFLVPIRILTDASNYIIFQKNGNTAIMNMVRRGSATTVTSGVATGSPLGWFCLGFVWSVTGGYVKTYFNGTEAISNLALTNYVGNVADCIIGVNVASLWWSGFICNAAIWNIPLNIGEMIRLARI